MLLNGLEINRNQNMMAMIWLYSPATRHCSPKTQAKIVGPKTRIAPKGSTDKTNNRLNARRNSS